MPVYERSYRRWDGELSRHGPRFLPITTMGLKSALVSRSGWFVKFLLYGFMFASVLPTFALFLVNYVVTFRPLLLQKMAVFFDPLLPFRAIEYPLLTRFNLLFLVPIYTVLFGSGLIAKDRSSGALPLYLSRPLTLTDYVLGKFGVIASFVAMFTLLPNLVLWLFALLTDESGHALHDALVTLPAIVVENGAAVVTYGLTILAVSSLCRRPMYAALVWFGTFVVLPFLLEIVAAHLGKEWIAAISPNHSIYAVGFEVFDGAGMAERASQSGERSAQVIVDGIWRFAHFFRGMPLSAAWSSLAAWCGVSLLVLLTRLRRQEVVGESGARG
jgi:ABC-type transport system involved in multi-copper enzyme maturation permease subunit